MHPVSTPLKTLESFFRYRFPLENETLQQTRKLVEWEKTCEKAKEIIIYNPGQNIWDKL